MKSGIAESTVHDVMGLHSLITDMCSALPGLHHACGIEYSPQSSNSHNK